MLLVPALLALPLLAGCAGPAAEPRVGLAQATGEVIINYLFAHGMAESYALSGRATDADLLQLVAYDKAAQAAITGAATEPGWTPVRRAAQAVLGLVTYTTSRDVARPGPQQPDPAPRKAG